MNIEICDPFEILKRKTFHETIKFKKSFSKEIKIVNEPPYESFQVDIKLLI